MAQNNNTESVKMSTGQAPLSSLSFQNKAKNRPQFGLN